MSSLSFITLILTLSSYVLIIGEGQDIFFGLKHKREVAHVLDINETDVIITCNVSCITAASIQIKNLSNTVVQSDSGNSLDYIIPVVPEDLHFKCVVTYNIPSFEITKEAYWSPHIIKEPGDAPYCYRNGTIAQPYNIGDVLLLGCLCDVQQLCEWKAVITVGLDSKKKNETTLNYTLTPLNDTRVLLQTVVGPIERLPADHLKTYLCISNVSSNSQICPIHSRNASIIDNVVTLNPTQSDECNVFENFSAQIATDSTTKLTDSTSEVSKQIAGIASLLVILIVVLVVLVVCVRAKVRKRPVDPRRNIRNEPSTSDASDSHPEFHLYDRSPNEGYTHSIPGVYDSPQSPSIKDKACVGRTGDNKHHGAAYPYYYPFGIECPDHEPPDYSNVKPYYVNGAQV